MRYIHLPLSVAFSIFLVSNAANALSVSQFSQLCSQAKPQKCHEVPLVRAYVGGALDMVASLQESKALATDLVCRPPEDLFEVEQIITYMEKNASEDNKQNAMYLVINYIQKHGGCPETSTKEN
jgi:hypothetical protein